MVNTSETKNEKLQNNEATVQVMKQPKTFAQQVEIIKEKGFIIDNDTECIGFLKQANYYRLSAYFLPFRKKDGTYFSNINFHRIQRIYEFDSRLRGVLFNYIFKVTYSIFLFSSDTMIFLFLFKMHIKKTVQLFKRNDI